MPRCALPEHLNDPDEIENAFPDDSQYGGWFGKIYRWYNKKTKTWFAFSHRCEGWLKWRKFPVELFKTGGTGPWRYETEGEDIILDTANSFILLSETPHYLSRIQRYKRWSFIVQWPLMVTFHFYPKKEDVPEPRKPYPDSDGKVWYGYWNHFDSDLVYWMVTSFFLGRCFK